MAESAVIKQSYYTPSESSRNERISRLSAGRNRGLDFGGNPYDQRAVRRMVDGIDLANLTLTPHNDIGVKYNRYRVEAGGRNYELELLQPIGRTSKRYDATLMGDDEVRYLNTIDLSKTTIPQAKDYLTREMLRYIQNSRK